MKTKMSRLLIALFAVAVFAGCNRNDRFAKQVTGYKPVYVAKDKLNALIYSTTPIAVKNAGQLYQKDNYIYLNEVGQGIHVINNTNPESPIIESFIKIPGVNHFGIKDNTMYANIPAGIVVIDITNVKNVTAKSFIEDATAGENFPNVPDMVVDSKTNRTYFECIDATKGIVIGWEKAELTNPSCYKSQD